MPRDINLRLVDDDTIVADGQSTAIDVEGGFRADIRLFLGTLAANGDTMVVTVQASINGGSNYFSVGVFPTIDGLDDNKIVARPVFIPKPGSGQTRTKVRLDYNVSANGTESFQIKSAWVEPLLSLAPPGGDVSVPEGLALLI